MPLVARLLVGTVGLALLGWGAVRLAVPPGAARPRLGAAPSGSAGVVDPAAPAHAAGAAQPTPSAEASCPFESAPPDAVDHGVPGGSAAPVQADLLGLGCPQLVRWAAPWLVVTEAGGAERRYRAGIAGDQLLVGDFTCTRRATVARYRPVDGALVWYPPLPASLDPGAWIEPRRTDEVAVRGVARVVHQASCDTVAVTPAG